MQRIGDGQTQVGYSMAERLGCRMTSCVIYTMHSETRSASFLVEPQNQDQQIFWFGPQNWQLRFGDLDLKITTMIF
jgi:hypothetical protein